MLTMFTIKVTEANESKQLPQNDMMWIMGKLGLSVIWSDIQ